LAWLTANRGLGMSSSMAVADTGSVHRDGLRRAA
jgi:hypothetical protein